MTLATLADTSAEVVLVPELELVEGKNCESIIVTTHVERAGFRNDEG